MAKKDIRIISPEEMGITLPPVKMTDDEVKNTASFFANDVEECNRQLIESEKFYNSLHNLWDNLTGGDYMPTKSVRDIAELGKTMVSARTLSASIAHQRHQVRKNISDMVNKKAGIDDDTVSGANATARELLLLIRRGAEPLPPPSHAQSAGNNQQSRERELELLDAKANKYIAKGAIKMSTNDKLVGLSGHVKYEYDKNKKIFVAINEQTGSVIANFPKERLPTGRITKMVDGVVYTSNGEIFPIRGAKRSED